MATLLTVLAIISNSDLEYDLVGMFGSELWQEGLAIATLWVSAIVIFWISQFHSPMAGTLYPILPSGFVE